MENTMIGMPILVLILLAFLFFTYIHKNQATRINKNSYRYGYFLEIIVRGMNIRNHRSCPLIQLRS